MDDIELRAMQEMLKALVDLDEATQRRVVSWVSERLGMQVGARQQGAWAATAGGMDAGRSANIEDERSETFAELFNAASPVTQPQKALVAGYWLQVCSGQDQFSSQSVNKELQDLGHAIKNVTQAFTQLKNRKPALAIQVRKAGKSQQARKLYKITRAGLDAVQDLLAGQSLE